MHASTESSSESEDSELVPEQSEQAGVAVKAEAAAVRRATPDAGISAADAGISAADAGSSAAAAGSSAAAAGSSAAESPAKAEDSAVRPAACPEQPEQLESVKVQGCESGPVKVEAMVEVETEKVRSPTSEILSPTSKIARSRPARLVCDARQFTLLPQLREVWGGTGGGGTCGLEVARNWFGVVRNSEVARSGSEVARKWLGSGSEVGCWCQVRAYEG